MASILIVHIGDQRLGLRIADVVEVVWAVAITPLPDAPPIVNGVVDVRGAVVPVLETGIRFGLPPKALALSDRFVVVGGAARPFILRVDRADEIIEVEDDDVSPVESFGPSPSGVSGIARLPDGLVLIHHMDSFLSGTETALLEESLSAANAAQLA